MWQHAANPTKKKNRLIDMLTEAIKIFGSRQDSQATEERCTIHFNGIEKPYIVINVDEKLSSEIPGKKPDRIVFLKHRELKLICPIELKSTLSDPGDAMRQLQGGTDYVEKKLRTSKEFTLFPVIAYGQLAQDGRYVQHDIEADWFRVRFNGKKYDINLIESGQELIDKIKSVYKF